MFATLSTHQCLSHAHLTSAGYTSGQGGSLVIGDYCTARNCGAGFNGSDRLACLDMGAHCVAEGCTNGIAAGPRAFIDTGVTVREKGETGQCVRKTDTRSHLHHCMFHRSGLHGTCMTWGWCMQSPGLGSCWPLSCLTFNQGMQSATSS